MLWTDFNRIKQQIYVPDIPNAGEAIIAPLECKKSVDQARG